MLPPHPVECSLLPPCSGVAEVSRETLAVKERAEQFYQTGVAHYEVRARALCWCFVAVGGAVLPCMSCREKQVHCCHGHETLSQLLLQSDALTKYPPADPRPSCQIAQATEAQALELLRRGVRCIAVDYRQESIAAGVVAAAVLLPGPRRFLFRHTLGR